MHQRKLINRPSLAISISNNYVGIAPPFEMYKTS